MIRIRLYVALYFVATMLLDVAYRTLDRLARGHPSNWSVVLLEQATGYAGAAAMLPFIFWSARRFPFRFSAACIAWHTGAVAVFSIVHTSWNWGSRIVLFDLFKGTTYDYGLMPLRYLMELPSDILTYGIWMGAYAVYREWLRARDLEVQLVSARLENLSRQLRPHFLFNALNAISSVMYEDLPRAERMLDRLCDFLRATLHLPESPMVPVAAELALVRQYLDVMECRLEDQLCFAIRCDPGAGAALLPVLLLQPLVENAVEHGRDPATGKLDIGIEAAAGRIDGMVRISIRDNGAGPEPKSEGQGLWNARQRLGTVYGGRAALRLSRHPDGGALVEIDIPV
jgi:signal transduction histidine kinase